MAPSLPLWLLTFAALCALVRAQRQVKIYDVQGASHRSPLEGESVSVDGIVTAVGKRGFYLQDSVGDSDPATSDAIFIFTDTPPAVNVSDSVRATGRVTEYAPGGVRAGLSVTQIAAARLTPPALLSRGNALPPAVPIVVGTLPHNTRRIPTGQIDGDAFASFDPTADALDFFESLEGMLVTVRDPATVSTRTRFGALWVVPDLGAGFSLGERGALPIGPRDFNPERVQIDADPAVFNASVPDLPVGTQLGALTGVLSYAFGNYQLVPTRPVVVVTPSALAPMTTRFGATRWASATVKVATLNTLNLDPTDAPAKFAGLAAQIVRNLRLPEVVALQEVQDANGPAKGGPVSAAVTLQRLVDAVAEDAGCGALGVCPTYGFIDNRFIAAEASGGQPGGNGRTAFLYRLDRVAVTGVRPVGDPAAHSANKTSPFFRSRLPLAVQFRHHWSGRPFEVVNVHFTGKGGSAPLFGARQPADARQEDAAVNGGLGRRVRQAAAVRDYVLARPAAMRRRVVVTGDFNEYEFVSPLTALAEGAGLTLMTPRIPRGERYTFIYQGNAQVLDHFLVGADLAPSAEVQIVHTNAEFPGAVSDHDPVVAQFTV